MDDATAKGGQAAEQKPANEAPKAPAATPAAKVPTPEPEAQAPAPDAPPAAPTGPVLSEKDNAVVQQWLSSYVRGGPIARHVESWNALSDALPHLVAALTKGD